MKNLFYILSLVLCLTACGEKPEEKAFIDNNIKSFLEYDEIAGITPKIQLSNVLTKMSESKLRVSDYKFSKDCQYAADFVISNMDTVQKFYQEYVSSYTDFINSLEQTDSKSIESLLNRANITLLIEKYSDSKKALKEVSKYSSCKGLIQSSLYNTNILFNEISKPDLSINTINKCIDNKADITARDLLGDTILHLALRNENPQILSIVKTLIENGADVNADGMFETPLNSAVRSNNPQAYELVKLLIENGADVNAKDKLGITALISAINSDNPQALEIVKLLVENGADVNTKNKDNKTVLMLAVRSENLQALDIVKLLINNGADVNAKDNYGTTTLMYTPLSKNPKKEEIIKFLKEYGAK